jgi:hypothetical protein
MLERVFGWLGGSGVEGGNGKGDVPVRTAPAQ